MRRGHPNVGGWRSENQRHFRPRNVGLPHFRLPRPFGPPEGLRFRSPHPRPYRAIRSFGHARGHADEQLEQHRNQYRINNLERRQNQEKESYKHNRHDLPTFSHQSQRDNDQGAKHNSRFFQSPSTSQQVHVNSMGDTDFRYHPKENNDEFSSHKKSPWRHSAPQHNYNQQYEDHKQYEDYKNACKTPKRYNHVDEMPLPDYSGHRPPASDHYTATSSANNNNSQYTHSVDDTVDIVRKRLMNRNRQPSPESLRQQSNVDEDLRTERVEHYQTPPREQPVRRKVQRPKQNIKSNCNNMKNKIVQQLFKMDKTKIHKLMDNPSSSSKFEYAISTLITEGQNSLNRHMRSMAEKSLYNSSSDFIQSDSNSFYEDVFMKQMQGILDPKDTELLGDIKPVVLAELSRVLQIDDYDEGIPDQSHYMQNVEPDDYHESMPHQSRRYTQKIETDDYSYFNEDYNTEQHGQDTFYSDQFEGYENYDQINSSEQHSTFESKPLYERRKNKKKDPCNERQSPENRCSSQSTDASFDSQQGMQIKRSPCDEQIPLFNPNLDQLSDEDDPFAELDQQYHVEVDHNFIDSTSRAPSPQQSFVEYKNELPRVSKSPKQSRNIETPIDIQSDAQLLKESSIEIKKEIDSQIQSMANVTVALLPLKSTLNEAESLSPLKKECEEGMDSELNLEKENNTTIESVSEEHVIKKDNIKIEPKFDIDNTKSKIQRNSRKRSTDQKPSHRKEKRKKRAEADCEEIAQSIVNMFYTNDDQKKTSKDSKKVVPTEKTYSNKYVKRKDKNEKQCSSSPKSDESKKHISNSSSHSSVTPKIIANQESSSKSEAKVKLKSIDMFVEQPKKAAAHVARRNTATSVPIDKSPEDSRPKISTIPPPVVSFARKLTRRHIGTQVLLKLHNKHCQSDKTEIFCKETQTDPISISPPKPNLSNPLERMKEIDMEIQVLLQEKFKLYHSIETKTDSVDTVPSISMKIFDMTEPIESNTIDLTEDAIVEDFTNIPTEELEEIAMETFADTIIPIKSDKKAKRQKVVQESPVTPKTPKSRNTRKTKNVKTPNISLIEQIITDDRPIEDIISLDDLETTPVKSKKKCKAVPKKKASKKSKLSKVLQSQPTMKSCCVVVERIDISHYLNSAKKVDNNNLLKLELPVVDNKSLPESSNTPEVSYEEMSDINVTAQVIEDVVNDLQFDMLDVSEDIIIGDICEVKTDKADGKPISEDIILDNSQSSMEEAVAEASTADECKMYDYSTNDNLRREAITVSGHADAVLAIECIENDFIVACLDGNVYHFSGNGQLINTLRGSNLAVTCLTIVRDKYETTVYTGSLDSRIRYYDLETGMEKGPECNVLSPIQTMDRAWDTVFVGTRTGYVLQFECKNNMLIPISTVKFSEQSILALRALKEGPRKVLLVAARSENVTIKDAQTGLLLRTLSGPKMTVYTLLFEDGKVYCGTSSHNIHVFDYTNGSHVWSHAGGKGAVCLRARGGLVFAGCYDGCVYVFREGEARPLAHIRGPSLMLLSLAVRGSSIIAGYKDRGLYIWKMPLAIIQEMVL